MAPPFDALLVDLDSTILDESYVPTASAAACAEIAKVHPRFDPRLLAEANLSAFLHYWPAAEPAWVLGDLSSDQLRLDTWERTFATFEKPDPHLVAWAAELHHAIEVPMYRAFDDVNVLLDAAQALGIRTAVATNGASDTQREKLSALGLTARFDALIISAEVGAAKPDPRIFEAALAALSVEPSRAAHVGDNPGADIAGARAAGIHSFWLNRAGETPSRDTPRPDRDIRSLSQIVPFLEGTEVFD
jgi:HAD superfamily hydrolase (TIGR01549 family)